MLTTESFERLKNVNRDGLVRSAVQHLPTITPENIRQKIYQRRAFSEEESAALTATLRELVDDIHDAINGKIKPKTNNGK